MTQRPETNRRAPVDVTAIPWLDTPEIAPEAPQSTPDDHIRRAQEPAAPTPAAPAPAPTHPEPVVPVQPEIVDKNTGWSYTAPRRGTRTPWN